ncbi:hypothetical protein WN71_015410 [Streptomyces mangrovisoli]|uniref:Protein YobA n=1 Tax=Streptomyces mangrovisoli TaxID=1428628 RepID=A0A1J4NYG9_9ACTN|nr:hypothetical protein WN71_015410 [Streptomyces mangrovisoli]
MVGTVLALLVPLVLGAAGTASAHAALRGSDPSDGGVVKSAPRYVTLTFSESVTLLDDSFRVLDPGNRRLRTGEPAHAPGRSDTARVRLPGRLATGTYTVAWRVVSADSHPVSGALTFSVGKPSTTPPQIAADPVEDPVTGSLYDLARYAAYLAAALLVGTAAFAALCRPPDRSVLRRPLLWGWWALFASTAVLLLLRAPYEAGTGPAAAFDGEGLRRALTGRPGLALLARLALLAAAVPLGAWQRRRTTRAGLAAGTALAVALTLTWALTDHASAGIQVPVAVASSVLHLLATAVWLGGLAALLTTLRAAPADADLAAPVRRFSRIAFGAVAVLVVTGVYQSWRGLGSWQALTDTSYGRLLLAKTAAVLLLLAVASRSRRWTGRLGETGAAGARERVPERDPERGPERVQEPASVGATCVPAEAAGRTAPAAVRASDASDALDASDARDAPHALNAPDAPDALGAFDASDAPDTLGAPSPPGPPGAKSAKSAPGAPDTPGTSGTSGTSGDDPRKALRRTVLAEVAVAVVVLLITTVLTSTLPGRAAAEEQASAGAQTGLPVASVTTVPFDTGTAGGRGSVQVTLDPGRAGRMSAQAVVFGADGGLAAVPELRVSFTLSSRRIGPIDAKLTDRGGYWACDSLDLPLPGTWTMKVTVRVSDIDQVSVERPVRITR